MTPALTSAMNPTANPNLPRTRQSAALPAGSSPVQRMRRLVAKGQSPLQATLAEVGDAWGPAARVETWLELDANKRGLTPRLAQLLEDSRVTDVVINSTQCWADWGQGLQRVDLGLTSEAEVRQLAGRLAAVSGQRLDEASPILEGTLREGLRIHAVIPPISAEGTLISLRSHKREPLSLQQMVQTGSMAADLAEILARLVQAGASILICGATGSGKTTLLTALLGEVDPTQRIVCIEEATEAHPNHPHVVHMQERPQNVEGKGQVTLSDLVRAAMRMRPDRLVLGECRGREIRDVLAALNTGHQGGMTTLHANSVADVPARLIALGALADLTELAVSALAVAAFDLVVQMQRTDRGRHVSALGVLKPGGKAMLGQEVLRVGDSGRLHPREGWLIFASKWGLAKLGPVQ